MKKIISAVLLFLVMSTTGCSWSGLGSSKLKVVTSIFPLGSLVDNLAGVDKVSVDVVVTPGSSPTDYSSAKVDAAELKQADLVVLIGGSFDGWLKDAAVIAGVDEKKIVTLKDHVDLIKKDSATPEEVAAGADFYPQIWLSPKRVEVMIKDITAKLKEIDSANAATYDSRYGDFDLELKSIDKYMSDEIAQFGQKKLVTLQDSWRYLAADYGMEVAGVIETQPGVEPKVEDLQALLAKMQGENLNVIFLEPGQPPKVVEDWAKSPLLKVGVLDPYGGIESRLTYQALMRYNTVEMRNYLK
jgi:zinc transport system substrate-binding protein